MAIDLRTGMRAGVLSTARVHWKSFIALWVYPIYMTAVSPLVDSRAGSPAAWFLLLGLPFFAAFAPAANLWMSDRIEYRYVVVLAIAAPFGIGVLASLVGGVFFP